MSQVRAIAEQYLARTAEGDIDHILELFAPDATLRVDGSPRIPWLGERITEAARREFFELLFAKVTVERFDVEKILTDSSDALILGELSDVVNATGRRFGFPFVIRITVADDRVTRYHMFEDSYALHEAFGD